MPDSDRWKAVEHGLLLRELKSLRDKWTGDSSMFRAIVDLEHTISEVCGAGWAILTLDSEKRDDAGN